MSYQVSLGNNGIRELFRRISEDPERGRELVVTFEGDNPSAMETEARNVRDNLGLAHVYPFNPPIYRMDVTYPEEDFYIDTWERATEFTQVPIQSSEKRIAAAGSTDVLVSWISLVEEVLDDSPGTNIADIAAGLNITLDPQLIDLYDQMARGFRSIEVDRIVLRRRRIYPSSFAQPRQPEAIPSIYRTAALINLFQVPVEVQAILPTTPASAPSGTRWGWKIRQDNLGLRSYERKAEESMEFTFAAWTTGDHDFIES